MDVKDTDLKEAARIVVELTQKYNRQHSTIVGSLSTQNNDLIRSMDKNIPTFLNLSEAGIVLFAYLLGVLPYMPIKFDSWPACYVTNDYINMKMQERSKMNGFAARQAVLF